MKAVMTETATTTVKAKGESKDKRKILKNGKILPSEKTGGEMLIAFN
jgi:hypothetical protein